jgi:chromosome segregation ATPase
LVTSAAAELARLSENDRSLDRIEAELEKTRKSGDEVRISIDQSNDQLTQLNTERIKLETDIGALTAQIKDKEAKRKELTGGEDIEEGIRSIDEKLKRIASAEKEYSQRLEKLEKPVSVNFIYKVFQHSLSNIIIRYNTFT